MNNLAFLKTQVIDLEHLLEEAKDDPILSRQLKQRVLAAQKALEAVTTDGTAIAPVTPELPRANDSLSALT